jgi:hypothetical protein
MSVPGGTDDRGDFERTVGEVVEELNARIETCHERRACPRCGAPVGERCWNMRSRHLPWHTKHPHEARWTAEVPKR